MIINWKLGLLAFVICSVTLVPALDSVYGNTVTTTHTPTFTDAFSVSGQEANLEGIAFNTDGTKMFIVGYEDAEVNEYACSTGFDVSTCTFVDLQSVSGQDSKPRGIAFNTAGTKMFILGDAGNDVTEYTLDTGFDISDNLTYVVGGESPSILGHENTPLGLAFNTDGTKMFITGSQNDYVNEYACSPGFDVSECSYSGDGERKLVSSEDAVPRGIAFNTDGTKMFIVGKTGDDVNEYACSTGFDVSTCNFTDVFSIFAQDNAPSGIAFNTAGTKMFVLGDAGNDVNEYDLDKDFIINHEKTFQLNSACAFDIVCKTTNSYDTADQELALLHPWLTEVILLDLQPSDRIVDTTTSMSHVQLEPGDTITITLNVQDDLGPDNIKQVSMYTNYGERPIDMNLFYANNFNDKGETSQSFYHWYPNNDDVAYGYDDTIQWKYVSGYTTNADYSELTKDRISISVGDLIHEASTSSEDRLVVSFTATFEDVMSKSNIKVKMADYDGLYNTVTLPFTIQVGNPDATFEDVMGKHTGYKFIPFLSDSKTLESIQQWTDPSSEMTDEQFTQLLGIQETELPSWVKNNLAQWVIEDKINLAVMIIAIEHLINLE